MIEERQAAVEAILNAGHIPAGMELFKAGDQTQKEIIEEWIKESDVYLLILGARYGSIDSELGISYTEWEYRLAGELGIPRFSLVLSDDYIDKKVRDELLKTKDIERNMEKFSNFKTDVESHIVKFIDHHQAIKGAILGSLNDITRRRKDLKGWIRYSEKYDEERYYQLLQDKQKFKDQLANNEKLSKKQTKDLKQGEDILSIKINYQIFKKIQESLKKAKKNITDLN